VKIIRTKNRHIILHTRNWKGGWQQTIFCDDYRKMLGV